MQRTTMDDRTTLDCLVIGGGPVGLTAALYLQRFRRSVLVVDAGASRARWIPESHNIPFFARGIAGPEILSREREHASRYGVRTLAGNVTALERTADGFAATVAAADGVAADGAAGDAGPRRILSRKILLATGARDVEPDLPDIASAVHDGLVRYCPICDGYESIGKRVAVIGRGDRGVGEALFIRRTYCRDVTLLSLGSRLELSDDDARELRERGVSVVTAPVARLDRDEAGVRVLPRDGEALSFDILYAALGITYRSDLALDLGAACDDRKALIVDAHAQTSVEGLYAAGDVVTGLDQIVVGMGQAALAATHIHNRCEPRTQDE
ncbi:NAD(P)/FAD-dependent oxidoreductase [Jiella sp. M17.18]|uniref:NAD(P)/FAD-dependent oxidoreductase n=1 Tax=Jiella sp. M17.18 TaxID=3234247 RepID=UPI0034DEA1B5